MSTVKPQAGIEYGAFPTEEFRAARVGEAALSLARFLGVETRAAARMLADGTATAEIRSRHADPLVARRLLERKYRAP